MERGVAMVAPSPTSPRGFARRPELTSALSSAVLEIQRILSSQRSAISNDIGASHSLTGVVWASTQASAFDLHRFAKARLAVVRADGQAAPTERALASFESVLRSLVADNGPTPQVGATSSGSVEIQWLVDGNLVSALFDESGICYVLAVDNQDEVLLDEEVPAGVLPEELRVGLADRLIAMSGGIVERPTSWGASGEWR